MYNVIDYSDNYSKTSGGLWLLYRDGPALDDNGIIVYFAGQIWFFPEKFRLWKLFTEWSLRGKKLLDLWLHI